MNIPERQVSGALGGYLQRRHFFAPGRVLRLVEPVPLWLSYNESKVRGEI